MNRFGAALSTELDLDRAVRDCAERARSTLEGQAPDVALLFVSHEHHAGFPDLASRVLEATGAGCLLGCAGEAVVGESREVEAGPALALWLAHLPAARLTAFRLEAEVGDQEVRILGQPELPLKTAEDVRREQASLLLIGEPFSFPTAQLLEEWNDRFPGLPVFGGMASGGIQPGENRLFFQDQVHKDGGVALFLQGVPIRQVVSQGCRPVGKPMVITRSNLNVIEELAGKPPLEQLQSLFEESSEDERGKLQEAARTGGLHIGQVVDEHMSKPGRGDFLVRSVMGSDPNSGALMIGDVARRGRTVRFHLRDAASADEDLSELLSLAASLQSSAAALLFSCNGRGTRLFPEPSHDAECLQQQLGTVPVAGFFAQGEIGPVGGRNFLHGFTASVVLFDG